MTTGTAANTAMQNQAAQAALANQQQAQIDAIRAQERKEIEDNRNAIQKILDRWSGNP